MQIILLQNVKNLGKRGDVKNVSDGYARNFLFAKKLAEKVTEDNLKKMEEIKKEKIENEIMELEELRKKAGLLKNKTIQIKAKGKNGKLFGSVLTKDIAMLLKKEGFDILEKAILLENPIKQVGNYEIQIMLNAQIKTKIYLEVLED
jgi:large subunit ribosomal protein L9